MPDTPLALRNPPKIIVNKCGQFFVINTKDMNKTVRNLKHVFGLVFTFASQFRNPHSLIIMLR